MDKLKMHSPDMTQQNIEKIQALFPNCVTESNGANGELSWPLILTNLNKSYQIQSLKARKSAIS
ncbi:MAG: hypothetical protein E7K97_20250 [Providencia rettgeri]|nr:hypothetical protein [Providencia rettgeri]